jgi:hypothetical protein
VTGEDTLIPHLRTETDPLSETWSLTLREEYGLRMFENRMLRNIFGPKREEISRKIA